MRPSGKKNSSRYRLLESIKINGPMTATDLAGHLGISTIAIRQHLRGLKNEALVECEERRGRIGRPCKIWRLTASANAEFPDRHGHLTVQFLQSIRQTFGEAGLKKVLASWADNEVAEYQKHLPHETVSLSGRLEVLVAARRRQGYMAEMTTQPDGTLHMIENHCSIKDAAACCPEICCFEERAFSDALGAGVELNRIEHVLSGDRRCLFEVRLNPES